MARWISLLLLMGFGLAASAHERVLGPDAAPAGEVHETAAEAEAEEAAASAQGSPAGPDGRPGAAVPPSRAGQSRGAPDLRPPR